MPSLVTNTNTQSYDLLTQIAIIMDLMRECFEPKVLFRFQRDMSFDTTFCSSKSLCNPIENRSERHTTCHSMPFNAVLHGICYLFTTDL